MVVFHVLGTLRVHDGAGAEIPLPGPRQRALLARLLLEANVTVSADALVAGVWSDQRLPKDSRSALHVQISRLRQALEGSGADLITTAHGYRLELDEREIDAALFEATLAEGRALATAHPQDALAAYGRALGLWRGEAWSEFADSLARAEATRLEHLRESAREEHAELLNAVGDHSGALAAAGFLIDLNPLRERPYAVAMRALAGSGRSGEALALYSRLREELATELGTEPSRDLQDLHLRILRQEEGVAPASTSTIGVMAGVPVEGGSFVGRAPEMRRVSDALSAGRLVTLTGPGGVGKTRLAEEFAHARGTPGQAVWVDLTSLRDSKLVPKAFLDAIGVPDRPGSETLETVATALHHLDILLVVDNCEHVIDEAAAAVHTILSTTTRTKVLATSRQRLALVGEVVVALPPLTVPEDVDDPLFEATPPAAVQLLLDRARDAGYPLSLADPLTRQLVRSISHRLDGLPLAIELAAAQIANLGLTAVAEAGNLLDLAAGRRSVRTSHRSLRAALSWSYERLSPTERTLLTRLTVFPGSFSVGWAAAICSGGPVTAEEVPLALSTLTEKSLVARRGTAEANREHVLLRTVRHFSEEKWASADEADRVRRKHAEFVVDWAEQCAEIANRWGRPEPPTSFAGASDLRAAHEWTRHNDLALSVRLVAALCWYADVRADREVFRWAEQLSGSPGAEEHPLFPVVLAMASSSAAAVGDLRTASRLGEDSVSRADREHPLTPYCYYRHSTSAMMSGDTRAAAISAAIGWRVSRSATAPLGEVVNSGCLAVAYAQLGDQRTSARWRIRSARRAASLGVMAQAAAELFAGESLIRTDADQALKHLRHCCALALAAGLPFLLSAALTGVVTVEGRRQDSPEALSAYQDALTHWQKLGDQGGMWLVLRNLIPILSRNGLDEAALSLHEAVSTSFRSPPQGEERQLLQTATTMSRAVVGEHISTIRLRWSGASAADAAELALSSIDQILSSRAARP
ncbi:BTAD domain-containing putative transcriptional regulator [Micromonospora sp. NPDC051141]|uniref:BTAD domain-containing putative transcriptional regulator n=1 Tax=Micromonospora sp. NPDC051141 TaxID=3364284 RepID=UPI003796FD19